MAQGKNITFHFPSKKVLVSRLQGQNKMARYLFDWISGRKVSDHWPEFDGGENPQGNMWCEGGVVGNTSVVAENWEVGNLSEKGQDQIKHRETLSCDPITHYNSQFIHSIKITKTSQSFVLY